MHSAAPPPNADRIAARHTNIAVKNLWQVPWHQHLGTNPRRMSSPVRLPLLSEKSGVQRTHICRVCFSNTGVLLLHDGLLFISADFCFADFVYVCALNLFGWIRCLASFFKSGNCVKSGGWWLLIVCTCFNTVEFESIVLLKGVEKGCEAERERGCGVDWWRITSGKTRRTHVTRLTPLPYL